MKNCIVKIVNGVPVVFGEAGKDDMDSLVYIFEEEEAFNAALDAGLIPVGTLIVKTYDEVEMAGGPFDDALSDESENAVQNKVIKAKTDELQNELNAIGAIVQGNKYNNVEFPNGDVTKTIGDITLESGTWIIVVAGWSPLPNGSVISINGIAAECNTYSTSLVSFAKIDSETNHKLEGRTFNTNPATASATYTFYAIRIK